MGPSCSTARFNSLLGTLREPLSLGLWTTARIVGPVASSVVNLYARLSPAGDREVFASPGMKEMFTDDLVRASRRQLRAPILDLVLFGRDWGFSVRDVAVPMYFWHGDKDYIVPVAHGRHLAGLVPGAKLQVQAGGAHLANLALGGEVLDAILAHWPDPA